MNISNVNPVDALGELKAQIANLEKQEKALRDIIAAQGAGAYEGELFRASVSVADRETTDWKAVAEALLEKYKNLNSNGWHTKLVTANSTAKEVVTVRVAARK